MTLGGRLFAWFPAVHAAAIGAALVFALRAPLWLGAASLLAAVYLVPVMTYRLLALVSPVREGFSYLDAPTFSPWWAGQQTQLLFNALPFLEVPLFLVPGAFSLWLRSWGSRVGRSVYWTPRVQMVDRGMVRIGDGAIFGDQVACYAHVVRRRHGRLVLFVRPIVIGRGAFLGAGCRLGPGAEVADGATIPVLTDIYPNHSIESDRDDARSA